MRKQFLLVAAATFGALLLIGGPAASRAAASCGEAGVFWKMLTGNGGLADGAYNEIPVTDHGIDANCVGVGTGVYGLGQTSRVLLNGVRGQWVEVGWGELRTSTTGHGWSVFLEDGINGSAYSQLRQTYSCVAPGSTLGWTITIGGAPPPFVTNAIGYVQNCPPGNIYQVGSVDAFGYWNGWAEGEGFHRGTSDMRQAHRNLQYYQGGTWFSSADVACSLDQDGSWDGLKGATNYFSVVPENEGQTHTCYTSR